MNDSPRRDATDDLPSRPPGQSCEAAYRESVNKALVKTYLNTSPYPPGSDAGRFQAKIRRFNGTD